MDRDQAIKLLRNGPDAKDSWNRFCARVKDDEFAKLDLSEANLSHADLSGVSFRRLHLKGALFAGSNLTDASLAGCNVEGADFSNANLTRASLHSANAACASFRNADLTGATLSSCNASRADFTSSTLTIAAFDAANLDGAVLVRTRGVSGSHSADFQGARHGECARFTETWDKPTWDRLRTIGALPLFGVSYLGIASIWLWATLIELVNFYIETVRTAAKSDSDIFATLPMIPLPRHMGFTLLALILLALAATVYKLFCPNEVQEYSETRWVWELRNPVVPYRTLSASRRSLRWIAAAGYCVGGPWVVGLLGKRIFITLQILLL